MAQLKEGSVIKKSTGDEIIATINDLYGIDGKDGPIVDLGTFNDHTEVITHALMNQLPAGHYTFFLEGFPVFMLLKRDSHHYYGTFHDSAATFYYFVVSFLGTLVELKTIDLRDLMTDVPLP